MMQFWGRRAVSSAFEVYLVLATPPAEASERALWHDQLAIEPPIWGGPAAYAAAVSLAAAGARVWSWDDHGIVLSAFEVRLPRTLRYRRWGPDPPGRPAALPQPVGLES